MGQSLQLIGSGVYLSRHNYPNNASRVGAISLPIQLPKMQNSSLPYFENTPYWAYRLPQGNEFKNVRIKLTVRGHKTAGRNSILGVFHQTQNTDIDNVLGERLNINTTDPIELAGNWTEYYYWSPTSGQALPNEAGSFECDIDYPADRYLSVGPGNIVLISMWARETAANASTIYIDEILAVEIETPLSKWFNINPIYPINANIKRTNSSIFTWNTNIVLPNIASQYWYDPIMVKHAIEYKKEGEEPAFLTVTDSNNYQTVPANTFDTGQYQYRIHFYTYEDYEAVSEWANFIVIGEDAAPTITNVTNDSIPTVTWTDTNQAAYEVRIKDDKQNIIYDSDIVISEDLNHTVGKMLKNGTYIAEVRELNNYGIFSEWGSIEFTINTAPTDPPTNIFASVNNKHGVEISGTPAQSANMTFVVRRKLKTEEDEIIGIYEGEIFTDYTAEGNTYYAYALRSYNGGYADSESVPLQVKIKQYVLQDGRDLANHIDLEISNNMNYSAKWTEERSKILLNVLGRKYPVKEQGEWFNKVKEFTAYIKPEEWNKLLDIYYNSNVVFLKADKEFYACDMDIKDAGEYIGGGYLVTFTMTRIEDTKRLEIL